MDPESFSAFYFLKVSLYHFLKIKSHKDVTKQYGRNQCFSYFYCLMIEGMGSGFVPIEGMGSGLVPLTKGSGSRRPKTCGSGSATTEKCLCVFFLIKKSKNN
jgi:hypothetical protein